jgi:RimJ/RimL family protein N-acetyltransferase
MVKKAKSLPQKLILSGKYCRLEPLSEAACGESLWLSSGRCEEVWTYLFNGPWDNEKQFRNWLKICEHHQTRYYYSVIDLKSEKALGALSFKECSQEDATLELGGIFFSPQIQRTRITSEAVYLMARHAFDDLNYRRLQWKCDSKNEASKRAARRFGFVEEGTFRQHMIVKGRSRDTVYFSIIDSEWPRCKKAFEQWLDEGNFDKDGKQKRRLGEIRGKVESHKS